MRLPRRKFLQLAAGTAALPVMARVAGAQAYPSRPVRWIVSFAAGGPNDIVARIVGQYLSDHLGQQFIIENRAGAGGNVGMAAALASPPDGYTIAFAGPNYAINPALYDNLPFNFIRDSAPVGGTIRLANVMEVHPSVPANTLAEFIAYAKANPGKINFASGGVGTSPHLSGELLKTMTGIDLVHVPYRGGAPALTDLIAGQVQVMFDNIPTSADHVRSGRLRGLAVTGAERSQVLPDLPTVAEFLPGYEASAWYGLGAPKDTPAAIVERINAAVNAILADPASQARFTELGASLLPGSPADFGKLLADETEKWGKVVKFAGAKPE
jgi:tripartite-type tricarboxylate transporter receptor subunit TctC